MKAVNELLSDGTGRRDYVDRKGWLDGAVG